MTAQRGGPAAAIALTGIATAIFIWFAWKQGAYFSTVYLPGAIVLCGLLVVLLLAAPFPRRLEGPVRIALVALAALALWTLLSLLWTPVRAAAPQDFEHVMLYLAAFGIGVWATALAGRLTVLPLAVLAAAGGVIGVITTITLAGGTDLSSIFHDDATLRFPIGYRNAEAAFLLICLWPTVVLAAEGGLPWWLRSVLIGVATMLLELAVLSQSRGSVPAAAVAVLIFLLLSPRRLRAGAYLTLAALPVLLALPTLLDVYQFGNGRSPDLIPLLRDSARAIALTSIASVALAAVCIRGIEFRLNLGAQRVRQISWVAAGVAAAVIAVGGTLFVSRHGGPIGFVDQRIDEFTTAGYPDLRRQGVRFGANVGSNRSDFWRVSLHEGGDQFIAGGGAGSFATAYLRERESGESPRDPHSVEMLMFSELGVVGLLVFGAFAVAATAAGLRSRKSGAGGTALAVGALTSGAYWLTHSSYDWFFNYPALTTPVMFVLGAAAVPALRKAGEGLPRRLRLGVVAPLAVAVLIALPLFASQRYADQAFDDFPGDPNAALDGLDRAADLDPYNPQPLLVKGVIASRIGNEEVAIEAFGEAVDRTPDDYAGHYFLARALRSTDPAAAQEEVEEARRLNPLALEVRSLARSLEREQSEENPE